MYLIEQVVGMGQVSWGESVGGENLGNGMWVLVQSSDNEVGMELFDVFHGK